MAPGYSVTLEDAPGQRDLALLEDRVNDAAIAAAGVGDMAEFGLFVRDRGRLLAGVSAVVWGGCCELQALWVDPALRGRGLARELMAGAEAAARERGGTLGVLQAYDLLTRGLYERLGYEVLAVVENCPAGSAARLFRKAL